MTFTDASPDLERAILRGGSNSCVSFRSSTSVREKKRDQWIAAVVMAFAFVAMIAVIMSAGRGNVVVHGEGME